MIRDSAEEEGGEDAGDEPGTLAGLRPQVEAALHRFDSGSTRDRDELVPMLADLCNGSPTEKQIDALPNRYLARFFAYVVEGFSSEAPGAGTTP